MSDRGQPDPAFLNNVPTSVTSTTSVLTILSSLVSSSPTKTFSSTISSSITTTNITTSAHHTTLDSIYVYNPSTTLAIVFSILYLLLIPYLFYHTIFTPYIRKSVKQKHPYTITLFIATILATVGFSIRIISVSSATGRASISLYATSQTLIIVAPILVCATVYLLLVHLIHLCLPVAPSEKSHSHQRKTPITQIFLGISPHWLGRIFITSDVLSFLCQGSGSAIAASGGWQGTSKDVGTGLLIFGLVAQVATFTLYMIVLGLFCWRVGGGRKNPAAHSEQRVQCGGSRAMDGNTKILQRDFGFNPLVKQVVRGMWIASVCIEIRSIFRTIEFATGVHGPLFTHEWPLWVFEAVPMWMALVVLGVYHPTKWLQQKRRSAFVEKFASMIDASGTAGGAAGATGAGDG